MTYKVQNLKTGRFVKDAITRAVVIFESKEKAEKTANDFTRDSILDGRKPTRYAAVQNSEVA